MGGLTKACNSPRLILQHKRIQHDFVLPMHFFDYLQLLLFYDYRNTSTYFMTVYTCRGSSTQGRSAASIRSPFWRFVHSYLFWPISHHTAIAHYFDLEVHSEVGEFMTSYNVISYKNSRIQGTSTSSTRNTF